MTWNLRRTAMPVDRTSEATAEVPVLERPWTITLNILFGLADAAWSRSAGTCAVGAFALEPAEAPAARTLASTTTESTAALLPSRIRERLSEPPPRPQRALARTSVGLPRSCRICPAFSLQRLPYAVAGRMCAIELGGT